jgi:hypothetical protein
MINPHEAEMIELDEHGRALTSPTHNGPRSPGGTLERPDDEKANKSIFSRITKSVRGLYIKRKGQDIRYIKKQDIFHTLIYQSTNKILLLFLLAQV